MLRLLILVVSTCLAMPVWAQESDPPETPEPMPAVESEPQEDPAATITEAFARIDALSEVTVAFGAGIVSLGGTVSDIQHRDDADTIASKVDGVVFVDNQITVSEVASASDDPTANDAAIRQRLERVFANVRELSRVEVEVHAGVIRLSGSVLMPSASDSAESLAKSTEGAIYVENAIEEESAVSERISPAVARARQVLERFVASLPLLGFGFIIITVFVLLGGLITRFSFLFRRIEDKPLILGIVKQVIRLGVTGIGVVFVLELFDLTALVGAVLGGAGLAGLAFGLAFKDIAENYLASIMLSIRRPFQKDDWIMVDDLEGRVVRLTTRETVLMTLDGNHLRVPNTLVFRSVIMNYTRNPMRRIGFTVGIGVGEDVAVALTLGASTLADTPGVAQQPRAFGVVESLGDFTVNLRFYVWIDQTEADYFATKSESIRRLKLAFDHAGIDMPEPTQRVLQTPWDRPPPKPLPPLKLRADSEEAPAAQVNEQIEEDRRVSDEADLL